MKYDVKRDVTIKKQRFAYLYLTITASAWGSLYVASKFVLNQVPAFTLLFLRYLLAGTVLLMVLLKKQPEKIAKEDYKYIFLIGFGGYFLSVGAQLLGTKMANASLTSLINAMNPVSIILFASLILKEKFTVHKLVAVSAAIVGTYIIIGGARGSGQMLGIILSVISVLTWSLTTVVARHITQKYNSLSITTYGILIAAICALPLGLYEFATSNNNNLLKPSVIGSVLYIGLVCTALTNLLWNKSLSMIDAGSCSLFYPLQPMVAVLLGSLYLGERINSRFIAGAALIIGGVLFSILGGQKSLTYEYEGRPMKVFRVFSRGTHKKTQRTISHK
jgi:drug/metabolite transporter (DMT)-like permease